MTQAPDIARVAGLIGDPARAAMLTALMQGQALTATELAEEARVAKSTASSHLAKLEAGGLIAPRKSGRHRYFELSGEDASVALTALMGLAHRTGAVRVETGPRDDGLRRARICYDHLAGEMGVRLLDALLRRGVVARTATGLQLTERGRAALPGLGIDLGALSGRRALCRGCLDWSVRRDHLAGGLGAALWSRIRSAGWAERVEGTRLIRFTPSGEAAFAALFED